ncbi:hypothetical protein B0H17DRAFT_1183349 [Mycena rosella]|uniref:Uncharacterized protein n=1 Tax=Mycena rosella TaxID=1033263 RepID=A0AAD7G6M0_MYCRO|nr:hypothetical protein B0H17DRAFT_1183349 [Mycena rosella]
MADSLQAQMDSFRRQVEERITAQNVEITAQNVEIESLARRQERWLSVEDVKKREFELEWQRYNHPSEKVEDLAQRVLDEMREAAEWERSQRKRAESGCCGRRGWSKRSKDSPPTVAALSSEESEYPTEPPGGATVTLLTFIPANKSHRYTARMIADALGAWKKKMSSPKARAHITITTNSRCYTI